MKKIFYRSVLVFAIIAMASCKKEGTLNANLDAIDRNNPANTAVDTWLNDNYVVPYNIEVKYRWDAFELNLSKDLTPPKEEMVIPAMETVRDIWIKPYEKVGGADFMKINSPKQFVLVGSPEFNGDGTITLGTADGGRKIVLYVINNFSKSNRNGIKGMANLMYHEFTHILNQKLAFQPAFALVTKADYTANWNIPSLEEARSLGFITQYSRSNPIEDFAEMVCNMIVMGKPLFDATVDGLPEDPRTKLRKKEQLVVEYFKTAWNIDFYELQSTVQDAFDQLAPIVLKNSIGPDNLYSTFTAKPSEEPQSADFLAKWNTAKTAMNAVGFKLTQYSFTYLAGNVVTLRYTFTNSAGTTTYFGDADYKYTIDDAGVTKFTLVNPQPAGTTYSNMGVIKPYMTAVDSYIQGNTFQIDWAPGIDNSTKGLPGARGAFFKVGDPSSYLTGALN